MHEISATVSPESVLKIARIAQRVVIEHVSVSDVFLHGPDQALKLVSVETSTPAAKGFVAAVLNSPDLSATTYSLSSREVRAIVSDEPVEKLTMPLCEPFPDLVQDMWQLSHVTRSYLARALAGSIILASGIIENNPISIVLAALFLPFLSQLLAASFGLWSRDARLVLHGAKALLLSLIVALLSGAMVALIEGGPIKFESFRGPLGSFAISGVIGLTAGLSLGDDTGRRYLIGVAAAVQLASLPVWLGAASVLGLPSPEILHERMLTFAINFVTLAVSSGIGFATLQFRAGSKSRSFRHEGI